MVVVSSDDGFTDFSSRLTYKLPVVESLEGCQNSTTEIGRIEGCIIESSNDITIRGKYFGPNSAVVKILVGTTLCSNARHKIDDPHNVMYVVFERGVRARSARILIVSLKYHCTTHSCHCTLENYQYRLCYSSISSNITKY